MPDISVAAPDGGSFSGYLAMPPAGGGPGMVVIQEIFGVNRVMRDLTDTYAALGYVALCPDLFWRQEPGIQITDQSEADWARAFDLFQGFDVELGVGDLIAALDHLRQLDACAGKVGSVGYCLGGKLAYLMATRSDTDCSVGYYAVGLADLLDEAGNIGQPLLLHVAANDGFVAVDAQQAMHATLDANPRVTIHDYAGMEHAFARVGGEHWDAAAAALANQRTADFFTTHLG